MTNIECLEKEYKKFCGLPLEEQQRIWDESHLLGKTDSLDKYKKMVALYLRYKKAEHKILHDTVTGLNRVVSEERMKKHRIALVMSSMPEIIPVARVHRPTYCTHIFIRGVCCECGAIEGSKDAEVLATPPEKRAESEDR